MEQPQTTTAYLLAQCARYPALRPEDLLKALYQSVFGCGHFVTDDAAGIHRIQAELDTLPADSAVDVEPLDGPVCRLPLGYLQKNGLAPETLFRLFALSARGSAGREKQLEEKLQILLTLAKTGCLPFSGEEVSAAVSAWRNEGFPACRHSEIFRTVYAPAYRVIRREFVWTLPLLAAIDRKMVENQRTLVAIDGGSASGKTTLAALLAQIYDCNVFHMDDFFLRPGQRTPERLAEPGGNVDRERFYEEVLRPLAQGCPVRYRRYDCRTRILGEAAEIAPKSLNIVEGAYSMHPALADSYDLSAFLRISPELQKIRILARNGPKVGERFFNQWIPLEEQYFSALDPAGRCNLILEVEA